MCEHLTSLLRFRHVLAFANQVVVGWSVPGQNQSLFNVKCFTGGHGAYIFLLAYK